MAFQKGQSGNPNGRQKGTENKVTRDIRALAQALLDEKYWKRTKKRLDAGKLNPILEKTIWAYAHGEPKKTLRIEGEVGVLEKRGVLQQIPDDVLARIETAAVIGELDGSETVN